MTPVMFISPRRIAQILGSAVAFLFLANGLGVYSKYYLDHDWVYGLVPLFSLDGEANIPAWYASGTLLLSSLLLALIAAAERGSGNRYRRHWIGLSLIFLLMSIDEAAAIHEETIQPLREALNAGGIFYFTWVILGAAFALVVFMGYLRFLASLPRGIAGLFLAGGALYVAGALGLEMGGGQYAEVYGERNLTYAMITSFEELLEMLGILVFIYGLASYLSADVRTVRLCFNGETSSPGEEIPPEIPPRDVEEWPDWVFRSSKYRSSSGARR